MENLPTTDRFGFPLEICGRCCGTGQYSYNQMHGSRCYGCNGHGVRHTKEASPYFQAWAHDLKTKRQAIARTIQIGDELAILKPTGPITSKIVGWHTVANLEMTGEERGWSITANRDGTETRTPTSWGMVITFDDGEVCNAATDYIFRRRGWIDPAPYVAKSLVRPRAKVKA